MSPEPSFGMQDLVDIADHIAARDVSAVELVESTLQTIERLNPVLLAYITVLADEALATAAKLDAMQSAGASLGALHGIPISVKDLFWTRGTRTTAGSRVLADFTPDQDAGVVERLRQAGAIIIAKANMKEFACAPAHPDYGQTRNPWDPTKTASGSSGGSAAAVAAGMDFGSFGSDTGGSIRVPAAFCGIAGLKPTHGLISSFGMQLISPTLDHPGPLARSVRDIALLLQATAGYDPRDPVSADVRIPNYSVALDDRLVGLTVAVVTNMMGDDVNPDIRTAVSFAAEVFAELGTRVTEVEIPELGDGAANAHRVIMAPELSFSHREWIDRRNSDYSEKLLKQLVAGRDVPAHAYLEARNTRRRIQQAMDRVHETFDLLLMPTTPTAATAFEETYSGPELDRFMTTLTRRTAPFDLTGQPALTVPCGFSTEGLPIGLEIVGRPFEDALVLRAGHAFQVQTNYHRHRPALERLVPDS